MSPEAVFTGGLMLGLVLGIPVGLFIDLVFDVLGLNDDRRRT